MTIQNLNKIFRRYFNFNAPIDMLLTMAHGPNGAIIDIIKLDDELSRRDPEYNSDECTYKDLKDVSPFMYIELKYGKEAKKFIEQNI
jgi:hypothetical protein